MLRSHAYIALLLELAIVIIFLTASKFSLPFDQQFQLWKTYQDVHVMIFIGFGFLMSYLKRYGWSAVGYTYWAGVLAVQMGIIWQGCFDYVFCRPDEGDVCHHYIKVDLSMMVRGDVCAVAVLITVGAVMGKYTALQYMIMVIWEAFFYSINERIVYKVLGVADIGASITAHLFGALFGVVLAKTSNNIKANDGKHYGESYTNDLMAMIGTIFLFVYWPSFNGGMSRDTNFHRIVLNTALALLSSVVTSFIASSIWSFEGEKGKFKMEHIQNASLAGGVMIGTCCDMLGNPGVSLAIGFCAGLLSTYGFERVKPWISLHLYHDTCGITLLHLIPGFIGAVIGVIVSAVTEPENLEGDIATVFIKRGPPHFRTSQQQAAYQVYGILVTIAISGLSSAILGNILKAEWFGAPKSIHQMFSDDVGWETGETSSATEEIEYTFEQLMIKNKMLAQQNTNLQAERRKTIQFLLTEHQNLNPDKAGGE